MNREQEYRLLADNAFTRAVEEDSAQLTAIGGKADVPFCTAYVRF
jgi:hypothetical protein